MNSQNDKYVMGLQPSGGIYRWPYSVDPDYILGTGCFPKDGKDYMPISQMKPEIFTWQTVHEAQMPKYLYLELQKYHKDFMDKSIS